MLKNIALFDMDGTLCNYDDAIIRDYNSLRSPEDPDYSHDLPFDYLIKQQQGWWLSLEKLQLGFDILNNAVKIGFEPYILTQGPRVCPNAWG